MLTIKAALATLHNTYCASEIQRMQNRHWGGNVPLSDTQEQLKQLSYLFGSYDF